MSENTGVYCEGATHMHTVTFQLYKYDDGQLMIWDCDQWLKSHRVDQSEIVKLAEKWVMDGHVAPVAAELYSPSTNGMTAAWYRKNGNGYDFMDVGDTEWTYTSGVRGDVYPRPGTPTPRIAAHEFLERGVKHMRDRAVQRDSDAGERSMARAVAAFNAQEGTNLTEAQGWRFMIQLKYARAVNGVFVADDYEDMAAYAGLAGEAAQ